MHNLESSQTGGFRVHSLHYKPVSNHFSGGGGGEGLRVKSVSRDDSTKANESFDNGVFFDIKAKRTPSIISK